MPAKLPTIEYDRGEITRAVNSTKAYVHFKGRAWKVPSAFCGEHLAIRPTDRDGRYGIFFGANRIASIDLRSENTVGHVSEHPSAISPG